MIASLGMYDRPDTAAAQDGLWALIRDALRARGQPAPEALTRGRDLWEVWQSPDLVLGHTCGLPFRARLAGRVTLVATPDYGVEGCAPGYYRSVLVVRADDPRRALADFDGGRLAVNEALSQSGWAAPQAHLAAAGVRMVPWGPTGSHAASGQAVAEGRADLAALDAVSWRLFRRAEPWAARLRVLEATAPTPGLPLIAAAGTDPEPLRTALAAAVAALPEAERIALSLRGVVVLQPQAYTAVPLPPAPWA